MAVPFFFFFLFWCVCIPTYMWLIFNSFFSPAAVMSVVFPSGYLRAKESQNPCLPHFLDLPWMSSSHTLPHYPTPLFPFFHGHISSVRMQCILSQWDQRHCFKSAVEGVCMWCFGSGYIVINHINHITGHPYTLGLFLFCELLAALCSWFSDWGNHYRHW